MTIDADTEAQVDRAIEQRDLLEWVTNEYQVALDQLTNTMLALKARAETDTTLREYVQERMSK